MRIAGRPKCASTPRVVSALRYGSKWERRQPSNEIPASRTPSGAAAQYRPDHRGVLDLPPDITASVVFEFQLVGRAASEPVHPVRGSANRAVHAADVARPSAPDLVCEDHPRGILGDRIEGVRRGLTALRRTRRSPQGPGLYRTFCGNRLTVTTGTSNSSVSRKAARPSGPKASGISRCPSGKVPM